MDAPKTVLVTGCAGFIGSNFTKKFKEEFPQAQIVGIDNVDTGFAHLVDPAAIFYKGSFCDKKLVEEVFQKHKPEYVFHFGARPRVAFSVKYPAETTEANILGTVILLKAAADHGVKRFIFSSSSSVYGGAKRLPTKEEENSPNPVSPYALQKYVGECFCKMLGGYYNLDTVSLRYFNVFGPNQYADLSPYSTVISNWLEAIYFRPDKKPVLFGSAEQSRDFTYVENVIQANIAAMRHQGKFNGESFNIGGGGRVSLNEIKNLIEKNTGKEVVLDMQPPRAGDVDHSHADISKAQKWFGYQPVVNFEEGLKKTIAWFEDRLRSAESEPESNLEARK